MSQLKTVRLDTNITPNQGGTYSSASIQRGGPQVRAAAAEARAALLKMASEKLNAPVGAADDLEGNCVGRAEPNARQLRRADRRQAVPPGVYRIGAGEAAAEYKLVGKSVPRNDMPDKVSGKYVYMQHLRVDGMLHGRVVRPRGQGAYGDGAKILSVDEASIRDIPGARCCARAIFWRWWRRRNGTRCGRRRN